jgi:glycosyltransferase involved in cell wall biosynthesis
MPEISACLIVKNEEQLLPRCLDSLQGVDEIVICDTGSSDKTIEVAENYQAKIVHFDWCDDFASARNFAKNQASNDWILSIDADEYLKNNDLNKIKNFLSNCKTEGVEVVMRGENSYDQHNSIRIFQKHCDWVGKIHETVEVKSKSHSLAEITYGYSPAHELDPDLDLRILSSIPNPSPRDLYYLAREYYYRKQWQQAVDVLESQYLPAATWKPERADAWLMLARCLWGLQRGDDARTACLQAINNNAHFREALVFMGEISWPDNRMMWWKMSELADNRDVLFVRT